MKASIISFLIVITVISSNAQNPLWTGWHLGLSYYGNNVWNPGAQITGQKLIYDKKISRTTMRDVVKTKHRQLFIDANLGFYYDNPSHWTIFNNYEFQYRRVREKGKYRNIGLGPGLVRTILPETYKVDPNGQVSLVKNPGNWYFSPVFTLGLGRLWKRRGTNPWRLQLHTMMLVNYNLSLLPIINIEYGYVFGYKTKENYD